MRPLRGERTISVAKCPKQDLNLRWRTFKVRVSSAGLFGLMDKEGVERGFNPPCTTFQNGLARSPLSPGTKQWRLKPLFLVELTLASVLRESFKSIAWLLLVKRHILLRKRSREKIHRLRRKPAPGFQFASGVSHGPEASEAAPERRDVQQQEAAKQFVYWSFRIQAKK